MFQDPPAVFALRLDDGSDETDRVLAWGLAWADGAVTYDGRSGFGSHASAESAASLLGFTWPVRVEWLDDDPGRGSLSTDAAGATHG